MKVDIESIKGLDPRKVYVVEVRKKSLIAPAQDAFIQLGINVLVTVKGTIKYIEPKEKK